MLPASQGRRQRRAALDARTHDGTTSDVCFPVTYGLHRCDTHDLGYDPNCLGTNESAWSEYCAESWCYVDGDKCRDSSYTFWRSTYDQVGGYEGGFYWSYDTCGGSSNTLTKAPIGRATTHDEKTRGASASAKARRPPLL